MLHWVIGDRTGPDRAGRTGLRKTDPGKVECRTGLGETWHGQQNRTGAGPGRFVQGRGGVVQYWAVQRQAEWNRAAPDRTRQCRKRQHKSRYEDICDDCYSDWRGRFLDSDVNSWRGRPLSSDTNRLESSVDSSWRHRCLSSDYISKHGSTRDRRSGGWPVPVPRPRLRQQTQGSR